MQKSAPGRPPYLYRREMGISAALAWWSSHVNDYGDPELPPEDGDSVSWHPAWIPRTKRHRDHLPWSQYDSATNRYETGGPIWDLPRPTQGLQCHWPEPVHIHTCVIWHWIMGALSTQTIIGSSHHDYSGHRILWNTLLGPPRGDPKRPTPTNNIQRGDIHSAPSLDLGGGGGVRRSRVIFLGHATSDSILLHWWRSDCVHASGKTSTGKWRLGRDLWPGWSA